MSSDFLHCQLNPLTMLTTNFHFDTSWMLGKNVKSLIGLMGGWVNMILSPCSFQRKFKMQVVYVVDEAVSCKSII